MKQKDMVIVTAENKIVIVHYTSAELTQIALAEMKLKGYRVRKVHNVGVFKKRKNQVQSGWSDCQGYSGDGLIVLCEVKKINDVFSQAQIDRLNDCMECGGICLVATQNKFTGKFELNKWEDVGVPF